MRAWCARSGRGLRDRRKFAVRGEKFECVAEGVTATLSGEEANEWRKDGLRIRQVSTSRTRYTVPFEDGSFDFVWSMEAANTCRIKSLSTNSRACAGGRNDSRRDVVSPSAEGGRSARTGGEGADRMESRLLSSAWCSVADYERGSRRGDDGHSHGDWSDEVRPFWKGVLGRARGRIVSLLKTDQLRLVFFVAPLMQTGLATGTIRSFITVPL